MRQAVPHPVWIGHAGDGRDFARLHEAGIRAVVQLAVEEPAILLPRELLHFRVPISDGAGNRADHLALAIRTVAELLSRRIPALVCCGAGMSRSPCIVAAALAITTGEPPEACLDTAAGRGPRDVSSSLWRDVSALVATWRSTPGRQERARDPGLASVAARLPASKAAPIGSFALIPARARGKL
ncbi:dual specificity protein phosphatase [Paludisphaera sp.]|uniref:dual specificity protein phosphatase family protein n=1 Tax=Paludisphaera sp. TaxID=2017432 RepID=UPI00301DE9C8